MDDVIAPPATAALLLISWDLRGIKECLRNDGNAMRWGGDE